MKKEQLLGLVQEIETELHGLDIKHPAMINVVREKLTDFKSKIREQNEDIIENIDEFIELLAECDIDGVIEIDELFELIEQLHQILYEIKDQIISNQHISKNILVQTKSLLQSVKDQS